MSPVDRVKDPLRLDIKSTQNLIGNAWSVTDLKTKVDFEVYE